MSTETEKCAKNMINRGRMGRKIATKRRKILFYMMAGSRIKKKKKTPHH